MKKYYCKIEECNKEVTYNTVHYGKGMCHSHGNSRPNRKRNYCVDCKKEIDNYSTRCRKCFHFWFRGENSPSYSCGKNYCIDCNKEIDNRTAKRCQTCHIKFAVGKNASNYINGLSEQNYPKEFNDNLKEQVRLRDDYSCKICNMIEEEHIIVYGLKFDCHHIDYNKDNCNINNLITLCKQCHVRTNFNRNYWIEFFNKIEVENK